MLREKVAAIIECLETLIFHHQALVVKIDLINLLLLLSLPSKQFFVRDFAEVNRIIRS